MTIVYTAPLALSDPKAVGTHALIIGVGEYPSLLGGKGPLLKKTMGLKQLSSPPVSAQTLASWFLGHEGPSQAVVGFRNPEAPLATIEMLLSPSQTYTRPDGSAVLVDLATRADITQAFVRWRERAAAHNDNVAVFYFCGHGVSGINDYLLPSDFGAVNRDNPWADAIDITETARAMRRLASGPLYFLIDACRQASRDVLSPGASPPALAYVDFDKEVRGFNRLILWAAGEGEAAFGAKADVSRFCAALIKALSGYEAEEAPEGKGWVVTGEIMAHSVSEILKTENASLELSNRQYVEQQLISSKAFHFATVPPNQPVRVRSSWSVGPEVRQLLTVWGVGDALSNKALEVLAEQLEAKNLQVQALQQEVKDWMQRYDELKRAFEAEPNNELLQRAQALLETGKLREAQAAYATLMKAAEARRDAEDARIASYSLNSGRILMMDFNPVEALPYYEKAYRLLPDNPEYALPYVDLLLKQLDYRGARPVLVAALARLRELAVSTPDRYRGQLALALNELGRLYDDGEHRSADARQAYEEALAIRRDLAQANPAAYRPDVARTLSNLGTVYFGEHRYADARKAFEEAVAIQRDVAQANPAAYRPDVAAMLNNLGANYSTEDRYADAHQAYEEALEIQRDVAQANPAAYLPYVARTLNNLGGNYEAMGRYADARQAYEEALAIQRDVAQANPAAYRPDVAAMLHNLGSVLDSEQRYADARQAYEEALAIRRDLAQANPAAYGPDVARTLHNLLILDIHEGR